MWVHSVGFKLGFGLSVLWMLLASVPISHAGEQREKLRDPTEPLGFVTQKAAQSKLELQAVFIRGNTREAVINGKRVKVGDSIGGATVLSIDEKSVAYRRHGSSVRLHLRDSVIDRK